MQSRIQTGLILAKQSFAIIRNHKKLMIFPVISTVVCAFILFLAMTPIGKIEVHAWATMQVTVKTYCIVFGLLFVAFAIINFIILIFHAATTRCVIQILQNKPYRLRDGFKVMLTHGWKLYRYKVIAFVGGVVIRVCEYWVDDWQQKNWVVQLFSGLKWNVVIFLVMPVIISETGNVRQAIQHSALLLKKTWGDNLRQRIGAPVVLLSCFLISLLPVIIAAMIGAKTLIIIASFITAILFLAINILHSATQMVLISALYLFASGQDVSQFYDRESLENAFRQKKQEKK